MQAAQHWAGDDSSRLCGVALTVSSRNALSNSLMWPRAIVVIGVFLHHTAQVVSMEDERVVKAFPFHAANAPLADSVRLRCLMGCLQLLKTSAPGDGCELLCVLFVAVMSEALGAFTPGSGFPELLRHPRVVRDLVHCLMCCFTWLTSCFQGSMRVSTMLLSTPGGSSGRSMTAGPREVGYSPAKHSSGGVK